MFRAMLRIGGYSVTSALDGAAALNTLERDGTPDLLILDVMMPGMDGLTLCKRIRQRTTTRETPILILTVEGDSLTMTESQQAGANAFAIKPISLDALLSTVRGLLKEQGAN